MTSAHDAGMEDLARRFQEQDEDYRRIGQRMANAVAEYLKMVRAGTPRSGAEHWLAGEAFDAVRLFGQLPEGDE